MRISYSWLKELTGLKWSANVMAERLTGCGIACEEIIPMGQHLDKVVVGEVVEINKIPGAAKNQKVTVTIGSRTLQVVCGASNIALGQKVPVAIGGARLADDVVITQTKIHNVLSEGMICSEKELGVSDQQAGIMLLEPDAKPGTLLVDLLKFDDQILDLELTPNRGDAWSAIGVARDLVALANVKLHTPQFSLEESNEKTADSISVKIADPDDCPRFVARIIRNVKIEESPWWLKKRLIAAGMRPVSTVVDITNYVMLETGNPIHAFDLDKFGSDTLLVRRAKKGETLTTLDGKTHSLTPDVLCITNGKKVMAAAGVMGGEESEVSDSTRNILLEVAYFKPAVIRHSRNRMGISSEASLRFERGVDPENLPRASERAASLFAQLCGGEVAQGSVDSYPVPIEPRQITFRPARCNKILGTKISAERMRMIFTGLQFSVAADDPFTVTVPTFRHDITGEIDLIEEVARIEGYDHIPDAVSNSGPLFAPTHWRDRFIEELRRVCTAIGFEEIVGHGLADSKLADLVHPELPAVRILNYVSEDLNIVRNSLLLSSLPVVSHNIAHREINLRLFEIGKAFSPPDSDGNWIEDLRLILVVSGETPSDWRINPRPNDFYDLSGVLNRLSEYFHWPNFEFIEKAVSYLKEPESFTVKFEDKEIGNIGMLNPKIAQKLDIKQPVHIAEISIIPFITRGKSHLSFEPMPIYPAAPRDLAFVVDESVRVSDLLKLVRQLAGGLAESVKIFDLYTGKQIPAGKKSIGISIIFRSKERSVTNDEIDKILSTIVSAAKKEYDADVREK